MLRWRQGVLFVVNEMLHFVDIRLHIYHTARGLRSSHIIRYDKFCLDILVPVFCVANVDIELDDRTSPRVLQFPHARMLRVCHARRRMKRKSSGNGAQTYANWDNLL